MISNTIGRHHDYIENDARSDNYTIITGRVVVVVVVVMAVVVVGGRRGPCLRRSPPSCRSGRQHVRTRTRACGCVFVCCRVQHGCNAGATLMQRGCNADATRVQRGCNTDATRVQHGCNADATRVQRGCSTGATRVQRASLAHRHHREGRWRAGASARLRVAMRRRAGARLCRRRGRARPCRGGGRCRRTHPT